MDAFSRVRPLPGFHLTAVLVPDEVQHGMYERRAPRVADDLRTEHDVAELPRDTFRQLVEPVDRECERIAFLVHAEVLALQLADLVRRHELQAQLSRFDAVRAQDLPDQLLGRVDIELRPGAVPDLDLDHRAYFRRCVPVSSACSL